MAKKPVRIQKTELCSRWLGSAGSTPPEGYDDEDMLDLDEPLRTLLEEHDWEEGATVHITIERI